MRLAVKARLDLVKVLASPLPNRREIAENILKVIKLLPILELGTVTILANFIGRQELRICLMYYREFYRELED